MNIKYQRFLQLGIATSSAILFACTPTATNNPSSTEAAEQTELSADNTDADALAASVIESAERVIALTSLSADLVATLNSEKLSGIPGSPILSQDSRFADIPIVSQRRTEPDLEQIIALQPDLVIGAKGFHDKALQRLDELDIPVLAADINSWEQLRSFTAELATIIEADASPLLERYDACLAQSPTANPTALVLVSRQPILAPNKNSWAGDFLKQFNIQNLAADLQEESEFDGYVTLSAEKVIETDPDAVMIVDTGEDLLGQLENEPFWSQLTAIQEGNVFSFDYFGLVNPGSISSIEAACEQLKSQLAE
ncbi:MAG: ABC transporter substrate-binding protein [Phormidesmis sp.]